MIPEQAFEDVSGVTPPVAIAWAGSTALRFIRQT